MGMQLTVIAGPDRGRSFPLNPGEAMLVGRSKATPTRLADPHVSRVHCEVEVEGDRVFVSDHDSAGGTFVNGRKVTRQELKPGDVIKIGDTQMRLQAEGMDNQTTVPPPPAKAAPERVTDLAGKTLAHFEVGPVVAKGA